MHDNEIEQLRAAPQEQLVPDDPASMADAETPDSVEFGAPRVRLKWFTPDGDAMLAHMARVSNPKAKKEDPAERLIGYLLRNHHWSPFEMVNLCVEIYTERDISAQILRHSKEFRFQEFSTRYAEVEDLRWSTECRFQDLKNRQGSRTVEEAMALTADDPEPGFIGGFDIEGTVSYFDAVVNETRVRSLEAYRELLERGVAKEVARRILPIGLMPTVMYINSNLRGWIHYLAERTKPGVQKEHREIALAVEPVFAAYFPLVWKAVVEYRQEQETNNWRVEQMIGIEQELPNLPRGVFYDAPDPLTVVRRLIDHHGVFYEFLKSSSEMTDRQIAARIDELRPQFTGLMS